MRPDSYKNSFMVAASLLLAVSFSLNQPIETQAQTGSSAAPKSAPDRGTRLQRPATAPPLKEGNSSVGLGGDPPANYASENANNGPSSLSAQGSASSSNNSAVVNASSGTTTVSLQGGVTRLDGSANSVGNPQRMPLTGKIESLIDTPLQARKPQSEQIPPQMFRAWLEAAHPQFALSASSNPAASVVALKGQWDNSSKTLDKFQIPHVKIGAGKITKFPLDQTRVVIVDCAGDVPRGEAFEKLRDFVNRGGYLLSTDWALDHFIDKTFLDRSGTSYIEWNKGVNKKDVVNATAYDTDPVLFNHAVTNAYWKLDEDSHLIRIRNRNAVRVLATSTQLASEDPDRAGVLAVVFKYGRGYVMHMTGHFDNNAKLAIGNFLPDPAPVIKISLRQALAANFVVAGLTQTPIKHQTTVPTNHPR